MPPFLGQAVPVFPGNADLTNPLLRLGDSIGEAIAQRRERNQLAEIGEAAKGGDLGALRDAAYGQGRIGIGLQADQAMNARQEALASRGFRERQLAQSQANADRAFGLQEREFEASNRHREAELGLKRLAAEFKAQGGFKDLKERADVESGLRKEFTKLSDDFIKVRDAHERVNASAQDPSAAGDLALIFNYMKILDPGSTVREGEFANAQNSGGVPQRVQSLYNSVINGQRLSDNIRRDFVDRAGKLYSAQERQHTRLVDQFTGIGNRLGVDVRNVTPDFGPGSAPNDPLGIRS